MTSFSLDFFLKVTAYLRMLTTKFGKKYLLEGEKVLTLEQLLVLKVYDRLIGH